MRLVDPVINELTRVGVTGITGHGEFLRGYCPFHKGSSGRTFSFNRATGRWSCFSTRCQHHAGGNLPHLLYLSGLDRHQAKLRASTLNLEALPEARHSGVVNQRAIDSSGKLQPGHLAAWRIDWDRVAYLYSCELAGEAPSGDKTAPEWRHYPHLKFMMSRRLKPGPLKAMDVGFDDSVNVLTFPLKNPVGGLLGVARRVPESGQSYVIGGSAYAPGTGKGQFFKVSKGSCVWGWHEQVAKINSGEPVVVVEGYADALHLMGAGVTCVAKLGSKLTASQLSLLSKVANAVVLWPDRDKPGLDGAADDVVRMLGKTNVRVVMPTFPDPAETPEGEIESILSRALEPYEYLGSLTSVSISL
jgi:hypothetical protein